MVVSFFFYNKLKNKKYLDFIDKNYLSINGYVYVYFYNKLENKVIIKKTNNNQILKGLIVTFNKSLNDVLKNINDKLFTNNTSFSKNTLFSNKNIYSVEEVNVYNKFGESFKSYIITKKI